jgi:hypothetical protein
MRKSETPPRRAAVLVSVVGAAGVVVVTALMAAGAAEADADPAHRPAITFDTVDPPEPTDPLPTFVTIPPTLLTIPPVTLVTIPTSSSTDATTTLPTTTTPATSAVTTEPASSAPVPGGSPGGDAIPPHLEITTAVVDCSGLLHLEYFTEANPEPAPATDHVIVLSALTNPALVSARRLVEQHTNGTFGHDLQAPSVDSYRVVVVADFEPDNLDGVILVDEAEAVLPVDCPAPSTTTAG